LENARLYEDLTQRNTDNERLNRELTSANFELARLDKAKSDFINIASHELRTPLTHVIGYNDILGEMIHSEDLDTAVGIQMIDSVRKSARRLEEIVETMFDVSKLDTRTLDLACTSVSLASIITVAIDNWARGIEERKLAMSVHGIASLPAVSADSKRMTQVFSHLIQNAIKSTPDGGKIDISGSVVEPENGTPVMVEVTVADSGIGIAAEDLERIFEKFYRVGDVLLHSTGETKFRGAGPGLGLTIARGIVEAHGGTLWVESPGYDEKTCPGSTFHVLLPLSRPHNKVK
jgi:signal transduction histidine kinase